MMSSKRAREMGELKARQARAEMGVLRAGFNR